ncbi:MAG: lipopolysaccharide assembly protein LapB [Pseudomonadales bacterium]|nr:lipopolysaccharide assembly protein LapB [Pseudomonadales bacterium]
MDSWFLLPALFGAIAIGWFIGRFNPLQIAEQFFSRKEKLNSTYLQAINYLMNAEHDRAAELFVEILKVNPETFETHINLGKMLRRQGEVDRAIRIHQNLLSHTEISPLMLDQARYELAKDFYKSGLLCRAENLLQDMVEDKTSYRHECLRLLVDIYRDEKEWAKAIETATHLKRKLFTSPSSQDRKLALAQSHFCCELANLSLRSSRLAEARKWLKEASGYNKNCVRASLIQAAMEQNAGDYREAIRVLKKIPEQNARYLSEALPLLAESYAALNDLSGYRDLLLGYMKQHQSVSVMLELASVIRKLEGEQPAADFVGRQLKERPSLRGLLQLIDIHLPHTSGKAQNNLGLLKNLMQELVAKKPLYRCEKCGFSGKKMHWMCPQCKQWESIGLIQGVEGD